MKKNTKGFTLIELLAVIVILGILVAIAIPSVTKILENSRRSTLLSNANELINTTRLNETQTPLTGGVYSYRATSADGTQATLLEKKITTSPWGKTIVTAKVTVNTTTNVYTVCITDGTHGISGNEAEINAANYTASTNDPDNLLVASCS